MNISIVIPNYNGEKLLLKNLPRVEEVIREYAKKHKALVEIVINDDGSSDKSKEILKNYEERKDLEVKYCIIYNKSNLGFSSTVNRGVEKASGDIVILLNTDVIPEKGFLEPLLSRFADEKVFAVGCMDKSIEKGGTILRGRGVGHFEKGFLKHTKGSLDRQDTLWVSGGSGAFRKKMWDKLGGLNELMNPFYWEDIDLSYRAQKAGFITLFEKESIVVHEHEEGAIKKYSTAKKVRITSYRNQYFFTWINLTDNSLILSHILWQPYHIIRSIFNKDASFLKGLIKALVKLPDVKWKRKLVQKQVVLSDKEVIRRVN